MWAIVTRNPVATRNVGKLGRYYIISRYSRLDIKHDDESQSIQIEITAAAEMFSQFNSFPESLFYSLYYYAITGNACMYKTPCLVEMRARGWPAIPGDRTEDSSCHPEFANKHENPAIEAEYTCYVMNKMKPLHVHDRGTFDNVLDHFIEALADGIISTDSVYNQLTKLAERTFRHMKYTEIIVFLPQSADQVVARMKLRNATAMDSRGLKYVSAQTFVFKTMATLCGWKTCTISTFEDALTAIEHIFLNSRIKDFVNIVRWQTTSNFKVDQPAWKFPLRRSTPGSAGWDLPIGCDITLNPKEWVRVPSGIILLYPANLYSLSVPRSSCADKNLNVKIGVIDTDYMGQIYITMKNTLKHAPITLKAGTFVSQLIFHGAEPHKLTVFLPDDSSLATARISERGEKGFGSSDSQ